jgi:RelA/SpoT family (p)ppGpp synthetase
MRVAARSGQQDKAETVSQVVERAAHGRTGAIVERSQVDSLHRLLDLCARYMSPTDLEMVYAAYAVADAAHAGVERVSGEPFIEHPIAVATILAELAIDVVGIAAALLHDTVEDTTLTLTEVEEQFGVGVARIVDGVTKFSAEAVELSSGDRDSDPVQIDNPTDIARQTRESKARQQSETVRKLLLALSEEPRVALVKIADRLHNLRTMSKMLPSQKEVKARETLDIYAPLAGRIGLYLIKSELEDRAFYFLDQAGYLKVKAQLASQATLHADWARRLCEHTSRELAAQGIDACMNWRLKGSYRSHREAEDNGMEIGELHDLIVFRVLVNSRDDCYQALRVIHSLGHPYSDRIRDYIAKPKNNGYQSLHTAVFALDERMAQFHIRTHRMHRAAQHGLATYWLERAAQGERVDENAPIRVEQVLGWVKQLTTWHEELDLSAKAYVATVRGDLLEEQVVVLTPKGEPMELPEGSTVLDFAYRIHTEIGDHTTGAQIRTNSSEGILVTQYVPVDYVLQRGDIVHVMTSQETQASPNWLTVAQTRYAQERIGRALRQLQRSSDKERTRHRGEPGVAIAPELDQPAVVQHPSGKVAHIELARCCYPCPGDPIVGLVRTRNAISIHRTCCHTLKRILDRRGQSAQSSPYPATLPVSWREIRNLAYRVHLLIGGEDHEGLMHELSTWAKRMGLNISGTRADANQARYKAAVTLTLDIPPGIQENLVMTTHRLERAVPSITSIQRDIHKGCEPEPC